MGTMKDKVIIFGYNDCAILAKFYLEKDSQYEPIAFCVDQEFLTTTEIEGLPVLPLESLPYSPSEVKFFVPLYDNKQRQKKADEIKAKGFSLISYISSKATCWGAIGENCFIMENNTIQPFVEIGDNVILWSGNHIGHHSKIYSNVFLSSHVVISGHCVVEQYCWFGVNSTIRDHITIAEGSFIAMSAVVVGNTESYCMYIGEPAKIKRRLQ